MKTTFKLFILILFLCIGLNESDAQNQISGRYYFSQSYDGNLNSINRRNTSFDYLSVSSMQFPGWPVQLVVGGSRYGCYANLPTSTGSFVYAGTSNGWYIFTFYGQQFLVSCDLRIVRYAVSPQMGFDEYIRK